jgi:hypothetical protein
LCRKVHPNWAIQSSNQIPAKIKPVITIVFIVSSVSKVHAGGVG